MLFQPDSTEPTIPVRFFEARPIEDDLEWFSEINHEVETGEAERIAVEGVSRQAIGDVDDQSPRCSIDTLTSSLK
jgi:hypothetical protein